MIISLNTIDDMRYDNFISFHGELVRVFKNFISFYPPVFAQEDQLKIFTVNSIMLKI